MRRPGLDRWAHLLLQLLLGFIFVMHGAQKLFGPGFYGEPWDGYLALFTRAGIVPAGFWLWVVTLAEFVGGLCIFFGFLTRLWAAALVVDMAVAVFAVHLKAGFFWLAPGGGLEFPLTLGVLALALVLMGPSFLSLDRRLGLERRMP